MQFKRILGLVFVLSLSFVLAACNAGAATPAPETTEPATGGDTGGSSDLTESASATVPTGGTLTVNYPSGWTATEVAGSITLSSSDMAQVVNVSYYDETMGTDAATVMNALSTGFAAAGTAGEVTELQLGGKDAVSFTVTSSVAGNEVVTSYYLVTLDTGFALVSGAADAATMEAIAASASFAS